ncbi:MAG TPA: type 1 glutamine amidotransferase [Leptolyngbyaceae cyanobacterium M33_DOE_097]|uniref:Type 1 glutamine amidotransferase n=1 Tax=Oscillatoriales cyanobacterium SpSt-418 TaxID=2282169 RepID=A0A7C3PDA5_9CYAN|nr:type 1 glutamine amidotransferase [Leptolyngbyaceae cyanobacterium M33_DOE_097]
MKFLVIKHVVAEGLGIFEQFCYEAGISVDVVELEKGDLFPALEKYSALWVMGGPMNVGDTKEYPWLVEEKALIWYAVTELQLPYMGVCLGAQLLADALGGEVGFMPAPEVGLLPINLTDAGYQHPLLQGLPQTYKVLQWHGQEITRLPLGATVLATSPQCQVQAFAVGDRTFGLQFHSEVTEVTVEDWVQIPTYRADLEATLGTTGCEDLKQAVAAQLPTMNQEAKIVFDNFLKIVQAA